MVKHGTAKKRRRNQKVSRKGPKHRDVRIAAGVPAEIRAAYDKNKSPEENLASFGFEADPNQFKKKSVPGGVGKKSAAFMGFAVVPQSDVLTTMPDKNPKRRKMTEMDQQYVVNCIKEHADDYKAMDRDIKLNVQQYTEAKMKKMCLTYLQLSANEKLVNL